jgi:hypothetical protein
MNRVMYSHPINDMQRNLCELRWVRAGWLCRAAWMNRREIPVAQAGKTCGMPFPLQLRVSIARICQRKKLPGSIEYLC